MLNSICRVSKPSVVAASAFIFSCFFFFTFVVFLHALLTLVKRDSLVDTKVCSFFIRVSIFENVTRSVYHIPGSWNLKLMISSIFGCLFERNWSCVFCVFLARISECKGKTTERGIAQQQAEAKAVKLRTSSLGTSSHKAWFKNQDWNVQVRNFGLI